MNSISAEQPVPYVEIVNQPSSEYDMRYEKEGRKNKIYAENYTSKKQLQYPKVKIVNGEGPATLIVSCVNKTEPYHIHPHKLVGPNCKHGVAVFNIGKKQNIFDLMGVSIQFTKKDDIEKRIQELNEKNVDPFIAGFDFDRQSIDLQNVRLCFQIFLRDSFDTTEIIRDKYHILKPVVSKVISNSSFKNTLSITKTFNLSSSCNDNSEVVIYIKKLEKNQKPLKVKFYDSSGWSSIVDIEDSKIHYQCAFNFKAPQYPKKIDKEKTVFFKLFIPSKTGEENQKESEEIEFVYMPSKSETMPLNSADVSNHSTDNLCHASMLNQNSNNYLNDSPSQISSQEESLPTLPSKRTFTDKNCAENSTIETKKMRICHVNSEPENNEAFDQENFENDRSNLDPVFFNFLDTPFNDIAAEVSEAIDQENLENGRSNLDPDFLNFLDTPFNDFVAEIREAIDQENLENGRSNLNPDIFNILENIPITTHL